MEQFKAHSQEILESQWLFITHLAAQQNQASHNPLQNENSTPQAYSM